MSYCCLTHLWHLTIGRTTLFAASEPTALSLSGKVNLLPRLTERHNRGFPLLCGAMQKQKRRILSLAATTILAATRQPSIWYAQAHKDANVPIDAQCTCAIDITSKAAYQYINERIKANGLDFDGIVCVSDMVALGALKALKERYVGIPSDVGIVGYDDISLAELMHPSLTTVRQNTQQAAKEMVTQLLNQFENKPTESQVVETTLIARRSTQHSD